MVGVVRHLSNAVVVSDPARSGPMITLLEVPGARTYGLRDEPSGGCRRGYGMI